MENKQSILSFYIHAIDHTSYDTNIPDIPAFTFPEGERCEGRGGITELLEEMNNMRGIIGEVE